MAQGKIREAFLPVAAPWIGEEEKRSVIDTLESGWITTGPKTKQFENEFAAYVGASHAVAVNSCTAALHVSLAALGIGPGDEVIISNLTFACNANVVLHLGAKPVFVDVDRKMQVMDPERVQAAITSRTKAIIPVHFAGLPAPMDEIHAIAAKHGIAVLEDAAHANGTLYRNQKIGSLPGTATTSFSFYAIKNLATGEGGMITTEDRKLAEQLRLYALHGMNRDAWKRYSAEGSWQYEIVVPGYKYNMTDLQAALGIEQLKKLDGFNSRRRQIASAYDRAFGKLESCLVPFDDPRHFHSRHLYTLLLNLERLRISRNEFIEELKRRKIGTTVHYTPLHMHPYYRDLFGFSPGDFPNSKWIFDRTVTLPLFPRMGDDDVAYVTEHVEDTLRSNCA